jgi:hypothetical protein
VYCRQGHCNERTAIIKSLSIGIMDSNPTRRRGPSFAPCCVVLLANRQVCVVVRRAVHRNCTPCGLRVFRGTACSSARKCRAGRMGAFQAALPPQWCALCRGKPHVVRFHDT